MFTTLKQNMLILKIQTSLLSKSSRRKQTLNQSDDVIFLLPSLSQRVPRHEVHQEAGRSQSCDHTHEIEAHHRKEPDRRWHRPNCGPCGTPSHTRSSQAGRPTLPSRCKIQVREEGIFIRSLLIVLPDVFY